jgi:hypothetical protein
MSDSLIVEPKPRALKALANFGRLPGVVLKRLVRPFVRWRARRWCNKNNEKIGYVA